MAEAWITRGRSVALCRHGARLWLAVKPLPPAELSLSGTPKSKASQVRGAECQFVHRWLIWQPRDEIDGNPDLKGGADAEPYLAGFHSDLEDDPAERDPWTIPVRLGA